MRNALLNLVYKRLININIFALGVALNFRFFTDNRRDIATILGLRLIRHEFIFINLEINWYYSRGYDIDYYYYPTIGIKLLLFGKTIINNCAKAERKALEEMRNISEMYEREKHNTDRRKVQHDQIL